jgi:hypothetical protein
MIVRGEEKNFLEARPGDHLMCPFECDICQFWKLRHQAPDNRRPADARAMELIRRANLDAFWSRASSTVNQNLTMVKEGIKIGSELRLSMYGPLGPWDPAFDHGMRTAFHVLTKSQQPGRHEELMKFSAARRARSAATNLGKAAASQSMVKQVWRLGNKRAESTRAPTDTEWYDRFMTGIENRLGNRLRQDLAISIGLMLELMRRFEEDYEAGEQDGRPLRTIAEHATYCVLTFCASFRGWETPKILLSYLREFSLNARTGDTPMGIEPHVALPLAGKFKLRGNMDQNVLVFVAEETKSGLKPRLWVDRLIRVLENEGVTSGWAFQQPDGSQTKMSDFNELVFEKLLEIQEIRPDVIAPELDVTEVIGLARSFRRGAVSQAGNQGVSESDINWMNRWRSKTGGDEKKGKSGNMRTMYSDEKIVMRPYLNFSGGL